MILGPLLDQTQSILFSTLSRVFLRLFKSYKITCSTLMAVNVTKSVHNL